MLVADLAGSRRSTERGGSGIRRWEASGAEEAPNSVSVGLDGVPWGAGKGQLCIEMEHVRQR